MTGSTPNMAHALDAGLRLCSVRASLAHARDAHRYAQWPLLREDIQKVEYERNL